MTDHDRAPRRQVSLWAGGVATAALLAAGCFTGGRLILSASEETRPVSGTDYATVLAEVDASLTAPIEALGGDDEAYETAAEALRAGADRLDATRAPETAVPAQESTVDAMRALADVAGKHGPGGSPACPAAAPRTTVLQSAEAGQVRDGAADLRAVDPAYAFGAFLPDPPAEQNRRLRNGAVVTKGGGRGSGELVVDNTGKGARETVVSVVNGDRTVLSLYVRGGSRASADRLPSGSYRIHVATGADWDAKGKGFTRECAFTRFDDTFQFDAPGTRWTISLAESKGGNAGTTGVDPRDAPRG